MVGESERGNWKEGMDGGREGLWEARNAGEEEGVRGEE